MKRYCAFMYMLIVANGSLNAMKDIDQKIEEHKDSPQKLAKLLVDIARIDKKDFDVQVAHKLVDSGVNIASDPFGEATKALHGAVIRGHCEYVKFLLDNNANIERQKSGTPLVWAAYNNRIKMVRLLLERKANPNATDDELRSALTWACKLESKHEIVELLLAAGADVNHRDAKLKTPLLYFHEKQCFSGRNWWFEDGEIIAKELERVGAKI